MHTSPLNISSRIAAPIEKVWIYYTRPEHITEWNFASEDWQCPLAENDLRPGGRYSTRMEAKDGPDGFNFEAVYDEVTEGESFSYTMSDGRKVFTKFIDLGGETEVKVRFDAESENPLEMQKQGWQAILDNFRNYAEKQSQKE